MSREALKISGDYSWGFEDKKDLKEKKEEEEKEKQDKKDKKKGIVTEEKDEVEKPLKDFLTL